MSAPLLDWESINRDWIDGLIGLLFRDMIGGALTSKLNQGASDATHPRKIDTGPDSYCHLCLWGGQFSRDLEVEHGEVEVHTFRACQKPDFNTRSLRRRSQSDNHRRAG